MEAIVWIVIIGIALFVIPIILGAVMFIGAIILDILGILFGIGMYFISLPFRIFFK